MTPTLRAIRRATKHIDAIFFAIGFGFVIYAAVIG